MNISVVIPLYNKADTITRALISVFSQKVQPFEVIIVNDGSTDGSEKIVEELNHPLIRLIHQNNAGVSAARNHGIEEVKGEWIAFLDADDEWEPGYLKKISELILNFPEANVFATSYYFGDYLGNKKQAGLSITSKDVQFIFQEYFKVASNSAPPLWTSAVTIKKTAIDQIGGFPEGIIAGEDLLTWARLAVKNEIAYCTETLSTFWLDKSHTYHSCPNRKFEKEDYVGDELVKLLQSSSFHSNSLKKYISLWHKMRASTFLRYGYFSRVFYECFTALKFNPLNYPIYVYLLMAFLPTRLRLFLFRKLSSY